MLSGSLHEEPLVCRLLVSLAAVLGGSCFLPILVCTRGVQVEGTPQVTR